ncbi:unnamed protein product [Gongylonema pulchrum]|uniref:DNA replication complex GINS protein PSF1 n=1 Tax=Gongylonema pulchrum TaxID=637853 RepID=A0A183D3H5_9BILA|nr:unnamed protein product [Gongylonema pulchrum]
MTLRSGSVSQKEEKHKLVAAVHARQCCIEYIKRCCCGYLQERMKRIKSLRWKLGGHLPEYIKNNMSEAELKWYEDYNNLVVEYQNSFGRNGLNLLLKMKPPKHLFVRVGFF